MPIGSCRALSAWLTLPTFSVCNIGVHRPQVDVIEHVEEVKAELQISGLSKKSLSKYSNDDPAS